MRVQGQRREADGVVRAGRAGAVLLVLVMLACGAQAGAQDIESLRKRGEAGDVKAQLELGQAYLYGKNVQKDAAVAAEWFKRAAAQGDLNADSALGSIYSLGLPGVPTDFPESFRWFRKAADQGDAPGEYNVGYAYMMGHGVPQDYNEAMKWFRKSADQGSMGGQFGIAMLYEKGLGVTQDNAEAVKWYRKSAEQGFSPSQYALAVHYAQGSGVVQDYGEAKAWARKAAAQGYGQAQQLVAWLDQTKQAPAAAPVNNRVSEGGAPPPPPRPTETGNGPTLEVTLKFIQDKVSAVNKVSYASPFDNTSNGTNGTNVFIDETSNISADPQACRVQYHRKITRDGQQTGEGDEWFLLKAVEKIEVIPVAEDINRLNAANGHPEFQSRPSNPPVWVIRLTRVDRGYNELYFDDDELANRVAKALLHASELCGAGQEKEPF